MSVGGTARRTVVELLSVASGHLADRGSPSPRLDAEVLLGHALGLRRLELYLHHDRPLTPPELDAFRELIRRRARGEPVAYLTGTVGFRTLELKTDARALVPRPETEVLVEVALAALPPNGTVLDVGTGAGGAALATAAERPDAVVTAIDLSSDALALAAENAEATGLSDRVELLESDLFAAVAGRRFDVVIANLPYIAVGDERLERSVYDFEPHLALFGGADGLDLLRRAIAEAPAHLVPGGLIALEVAEGQASAVVELLAAADFEQFAVARDLAGIDRVVSGRHP